MNPAMCECVWMTIVVVCVSRLDEEHVWVSAWVGGRLEGYVSSSDNLYYVVFKSSMSVYSLSV